MLRLIRSTLLSLVTAALLSALPALAATLPLSAVTMGTPTASFTPGKLGSYAIGQKTTRFSPGDTAVLFRLRWLFSKQNLGTRSLQVYYINPKGVVQTAGFTLNIRQGMLSTPIVTYWYLMLSKGTAPSSAVRWQAYFLFNGVLVDVADFTLVP